MKPILEFHAIRDYIYIQIDAIFLFAVSAIAVVAAVAAIHSASTHTADCTVVAHNYYMLVRFFSLLLLLLLFTKVNQQGIWQRAQSPSRSKPNPNRK